MNWKKVVIGIWAVAVAGFLIEFMLLLVGFLNRLREDTYLNYFLSHHRYWLFVTSSEFRDFFIAIVVHILLGIVIVIFLLPRILHFQAWQKVLVFVLSIIMIPFLTFIVIIQVIILQSGSAAGDGAAIIATVYGLPIGIILGIIFPFILFAVLENKQPDKDRID